jgi:hypothetical protein
VQKGNKIPIISTKKYKNQQVYTLLYNKMRTFAVLFAKRKRGKTEQNNHYNAIYIT